MGIAQLEEYKNYAQSIDDKYIQKLIRFANDPLISDLEPVIKYMVANKIKLEQEAFI
jgi:hypothetical protein